MQESVREKVVRVMADVFECQADEVAELRAGESPQWDSVGAASLVVALEDAFAVELDVEAAANLHTFNEVVEVIELALLRS